MHRNEAYRGETPPDNPVMTTLEVAHRWGKTPKQIRIWATKGAFPGAFKVGKTWVLPRASVLAREKGQPLTDDQETAAITA